MYKEKVRLLVMMALFIALNVVLVRFLSFQTVTLRIGFGFLSDSVCAMMFGPIVGGATAALSDIAGMLINSHGMPYFPGFTVNAALYGITYGLFLYRREKSYINIILCVVLQMVFIDLLMGTVWAFLFSNVMMGKAVGFVAVLVPRVASALVMVPIKVLVIKYLAVLLEKTPYLPKAS